MGKLFLHGRGNKSVKATPRAKLTVTCPAGLTVYAKSTHSSLTFGLVADDTGKAVFDRLTEGSWDITVSGVDNPPTKRIVIDDLDCDVSFPYMTIYVTYPRYSTCTCTDGDTILTAPDRSGSCSFDIYELGDWTISATNGVESGTEVVSVTSFVQNRSVDLIYDLWLIDYTKKRQVVDPVEFWGNDDENVEMTVNDDGSVSFKFLTANTSSTMSNMALDFTRYQYLYITSVLDREGTISLTLHHPSSTAMLSGSWPVDKDTSQVTLKCNMVGHVGDRLMRIGSDGTPNTTMTVRSLSLRDPVANFVMINVTYPMGSTCTCMKGDVTLTAPDNSGSCTFIVNELGDWVVHATNNVEYDTKTVSVSYFGDSKNVELVYDLWIIDDTGQRQVADISDVWLSKTSGSNSVTNDDGSMSITLDQGSANIVKNENNAVVFDFNYSGQLRLHTLPIDMRNYKALKYVYEARNKNIDSLGIADFETESIIQCKHFMTNNIGTELAMYNDSLSSGYSIVVAHTGTATVPSGSITLTRLVLVQDLTTAFIHVTYPVGMRCEFDVPSRYKYLVSPDTSGSWTIRGDELGECTIRLIVNSSKTVAKTVNVDAYGMHYYVDISSEV